jgi:hypothetical protein
MIMPSGSSRKNLEENNKEVTCQTTDIHHQETKEGSSDRSNLLDEELDADNFFIVGRSPDAFPAVNDIRDGRVTHISNHGVVIFQN